MDTPPAEKIDCEGCSGRGFTMSVDEDTGTRQPKEHSRCNGAGILIYRGTGNGGEPVYTAPKLWA